MTDLPVTYFRINSKARDAYLNEGYNHPVGNDKDDFISEWSRVWKEVDRAITEEWTNDLDGDCSLLDDVPPDRLLGIEVENEDMVCKRLLERIHAVVSRIVPDYSVDICDARGLMKTKNGDDYPHFNIFVEKRRILIYSESDEILTKLGVTDIETLEDGAQDMNELSAQDIEELKNRFAEIGCDVSDVGSTNFEIVSRDFSVRTHVLANPYYLEFGTFIRAIPKRSDVAGDLPNLYAFLHNANLRTKLTKCTCHSEVPEKDGAWPILVSVKLVTGKEGLTYEVGALKNLLQLWLQDVGEIIASEGPYDIQGLMKA